MKRASTLLTWWYLAIGGALTTAGAAASDDRVRWVLELVAVVMVLGTVVAARVRHLLTSSLSLLSAGAVVAFGLSRLLPGDTAASTHLVAVVAGISGYAITLAALFILLDRRGVNVRNGLAADALVVALSAWVIAWPALVQPIIDRWGVSAATVLHSMHQPIASVVLFLVVTLLLDTRNRSVSAWLLGGAITLQVLADLVDDLIDAGHLATGFDRLAMPLGIAAAVCLGGAFLHPSLTTLGRTQSDDQQSTLGRLVVTIGSLSFPVIVLGATSATGTADKVVRTISAISLAVLVTVRVVHTVRANSRSQAALLHGAQTDELTGLPNRNVLLQEITNLLGRSWANDQLPTLFYIDLDRFKNINDSLGHAAGDQVLRLMAHRLRDTAPEAATVAYVSGDEFVVLHPMPSSEDDALAVADELLAVLREPFALDHGDVFISASIGIATISATSSSSPADLVRHADSAMYRAKDEGRGRHAVYEEAMKDRVTHRLAVETALHRATDRGEMRLYHQPILDLFTNEVTGFEALMRWQQADGTIVSPAEFIPIAEDNGVIVSLGKWALLEGLTQLRCWIDEGVCSPRATMSVNVSAHQLREPDFPDTVSEALTRSGVSASLLWLEVTETVMINDAELARTTLTRLSELGVRIALDDFGTGFSSLSLLQKFPLHRIKIDRAFVRGLAESENDRSLVRTIIAMAKALDLDVVAEGVESKAQLDLLRDMKCKKAQGYLISHPVPADAMRTTVAALERIDQFLPLHRGMSTN